MASARWEAARRSISPNVLRCWQAIRNRSNPTPRSTEASPESPARDCPCHRDTHDSRNGLGSRPRGPHHSRRWPQARVHQPAPHSSTRGVRSGAHHRPSAIPDRRDRAGCAVALRRNVSLASLQPAGRSDRPRWSGPHLAEHRRGVCEWGRRAGPDGNDDGRAGRWADVPEGPRRRARAQSRARRTHDSRVFITARSTRSSFRRSCASTRVTSATS